MTLDLLVQADHAVTEQKRWTLLRRALMGRDPYIAYQVGLRGYLIESAQEIVCEVGDEKTIDQFARDVRGADRVLLGRAMARRGSPHRCYNFAVYHRPADVEDLQWCVIKSGNGNLMVRFAQNVRTANVRALETAVLDVGSVFYVYEFARHVVGADVRRLERFVLDNRHAEGAFWFASSVRGADLRACEAVVVQYGSAHTCFEFAQQVVGADVNALQRRAIQAADGQDPNIEYRALWGFASVVRGNDVGHLYASLVDTRLDHLAQRIKRECPWFGKSQDTLSNR